MSSSMNNPAFFDTFSTIDDYKQKVCSKVVEVIRTANRLILDEFEQIKRIPTSRERIEQLSAHLLCRMEKLKEPIQSTSWTGLEIDEQLEQLIDVNDTFFERIASALDRAEGIEPTSAVFNVVREVLHKPQVQYQWKIDNSYERPFIPKLSGKSYDTDKPRHPYADEIKTFQPNENQLECQEAQIPKSLEETKLTFIDTSEKLATLLEHLRQQCELAIDLEHHSTRSYQGFTCLMQISSRTEDFLIDTLILRDQLTILNEIFTNSNIVKVFHGADWDIEWLQKDFSLYVVNMFDTHQAARELNFPTLSLAYLLKHYCNRDVNKLYQMADWRFRPLPDEYLRYAREDTHYLLYIYDRLRQQLRDHGRSVFFKSKAICLKLYQKPTFDSNGYITLLPKKSLDQRQLNALKSLYIWRDRVAREEDESPSYVLPDLLLVRLAELLPKDMHGIQLACKSVPELVKKNIDEIQQLIHQATTATTTDPVSVSGGQEKRSDPDNSLTNDSNKRLKIPSSST